MTEIERRPGGIGVTWKISPKPFEDIAAHAESDAATAKGMALHEARMRGLTLAQIGERLNGLIGFMGGFFPKTP